MRKRLTPMEELTTRELLIKALRYLKIIDSMEASNPEWYLKEFRGHKDWEMGLTTTKIGLKRILEESTVLHYPTPIYDVHGIRTYSFVFTGEDGIDYILIDEDIKDDLENMEEE